MPRPASRRMTMPPQRLLEHLPGPLRTAAMQQMLLEAKTRVETIDRLSRDLQEARRTGAIGHVLAAINQLLALQPDHAEARSTADRFQQQVCEAAQRRLAAFRYEQAAALLRRVPEAVRARRRRRSANRPPSGHGWRNSCGPRRSPRPLWPRWPPDCRLPFPAIPRRRS